MDGMEIPVPHISSDEDLDTFVDYQSPHYTKPAISLPSLTIPSPASHNQLKRKHYDAPSEPSPFGDPSATQPRPTDDAGGDVDMIASKPAATEIETTTTTRRRRCRTKYKSKRRADAEENHASKDRSDSNSTVQKASDTEAKEEGSAGIEKKGATTADVGETSKEGEQSTPTSLSIPKPVDWDEVSAEIKPMSNDSTAAADASAEETATQDHACDGNSAGNDHESSTGATVVANDNGPDGDNDIDHDNDSGNGNGNDNGNEHTMTGAGAGAADERNDDIDAKDAGRNDTNDDTNGDTDGDAAGDGNGRNGRPGDGDTGVGGVDQGIDDNDDDEAHQPQAAPQFAHKADKLDYFNKVCSRVTEHLYVGSRYIASDKAVLAQHKITHIVNCAGHVCENSFPGEFAYMKLYLLDSANEDIMAVVYQVYAFIQKARENPDHRIFLHCQQGVSRSSTLAIATIMLDQNQGYDEVGSYVCI